MKYLTKRISTLIIGVMVLIAVLAVVLPNLVSAAAVTASLSPSASSVQQGSTFTVTVNLSTGSASILDAYGRVNFNASQIQFVSASYSSSGSWGAQGPDAGLNGSYYTFDVTTTTNPSGNLPLVQLTFKALASSGTSSITLSDVEVGDGDTPPIAVHDVSLQNTSVQLTDQSSSTGSENNNQTDANLSDEQPVPTNLMDTTGYPVEITIINSEGTPQTNLEVTLVSKTAITDANGIASFYGITPGEYTVTAEGVDSTINVVTGEPTNPQAFELTQIDNGSNNYTIFGVAAAIILTILGTLLYTKSNNKNGKTIKSP